MGFDNECIISIQSVPGRYFCPVCRTLIWPNEALQSKCSHLFCKPCLAYISTTSHACPCDGYLVTEADSKPLIGSDQLLADTIGKVAVHCLYHKSGCQWQGTLAECTIHRTGCKFGNSIVVCNRCGIQITHRHVQDHALICPGRWTQAQQPENDRSKGSTLPSSITSASAAVSTAMTAAPMVTVTLAASSAVMQTVAAPAAIAAATTAMTAASATVTAAASSAVVKTVAASAPAAVPSVATAVPGQVQGGMVVYPQVPFAEQYFQQQPPQYQHYYQQYPGNNPYQQQYQQYAQYQLQAYPQFAQPHTQSAPVVIVGQQQSQPYMQLQLQPPTQPQLFPPPIPVTAQQPQPLQPLPLPHGQIAGQPHPQPHLLKLQTNAQAPPPPHPGLPENLPIPSQQHPPCQYPQQQLPPQCSAFPTQQTVMQAQPQAHLQTVPLSHSSHATSDYQLYPQLTPGALKQGPTASHPQLASMPPPHHAQHPQPPPETQGHFPPQYPQHPQPPPETQGYFSLQPAMAPVPASINPVQQQVQHPVNQPDMQLHPQHHGAPQLQPHPGQMQQQEQQVQHPVNQPDMQLHPRHHGTPQLQPHPGQMQQQKQQVQHPVNQPAMQLHPRHHGAPQLQPHPGQLQQQEQQVQHQLNQPNMQLHPQHHGAPQLQALQPHPGQMQQQGALPLQQQLYHRQAVRPQEPAYMKHQVPGQPSSMCTSSHQVHTRPMVPNQGMSQQPCQQFFGVNSKPLPHGQSPNEVDPVRSTTGNPTSSQLQPSQLLYSGSQGTMLPASSASSTKGIFLPDNSGQVTQHQFRSSASDSCRHLFKSEFTEGLKQFPRPSYLDAGPKFDGYMSSYQPGASDRAPLVCGGANAFTLGSLPSYQSSSPFPHSSSSSVVHLDIGARDRTGVLYEHMGRKHDAAVAGHHNLAPKYGNHMDGLPPLRSSGQHYDCFSSSRFTLGGQLLREDFEERDPHSFGEPSKASNVLPPGIPHGSESLRSDHFGKGTIHSEAVGFGGLRSNLGIGEHGGRGNLPSYLHCGDTGLYHTFSSVSRETEIRGLDQSRKRKPGSMGWCRICKIDCETVEGLDLHSQTRGHHDMSMHLILSIKQENAERKKLNVGSAMASDSRNAYF